MLLPTAVLVACVASAAAPDLSLVEPRLERSAYALVTSDVGDASDLETVLEMLYTGYAEALGAAAARAERAIADAGGARIAQALEGRIRLDPSELRELRVAVVRAESAGWEDADAALAELLANLDALGVGADTGSLVRIACRLRREAWLGPRRDEADAPTYAGDGLDLVRLFEDQCSQGTLGAIDASSVRPLLDEYALRLDALLRSDGPRDRRGRLELRVAQVERDLAAQDRAEKDLIGRWRVRYALTMDAATQIGAALRASDAAAAAAWTAAVDRAMFPWLYEASEPERAAQWIVENRTLDASVKSDARRIVSAHRAKSAEVSGEMAALLLKARLQLGRIVTPRSDPSTLADRATQDVLRDLLRTSGQRAVLDDESADALAALLTERQRATMRADLAARAFGRRK